MNEPQPMEIDPIDDGPIQAVVAAGAPSASLPVNKSVVISEEDEARQAIDMLRGEDVAARVAAANRLEAIAAALGHQRTRDELLPFLTDGVDDEDEVLVAVASSLGKMVQHVGGPPHAQTLLAPVELLLTVEENTVRNVATESAKTIAKVLSPTVFQQKYATMVAELATNEWFTSRISAAGLIPDAFTRLTTQQQQEHLQYFNSLCRDDTPMVRRVASQNLGPMLEALVSVSGRVCFGENGSVGSIIIPLYEELASNEQPDSVRLQTTENCVAIGKTLSTVTKGSPLSLFEQGLVQRILPLIVATIDDRSWRVRWTAASKFANVITAFDPIPDVMDSLIPAYEKLLQDPEAEVRTAATFNLAAVAQCKAMVPPGMTTGRNGDDPPAANEPHTTVAERLVKRVTSLTEDDSEHVRAALAMVATELAPVLGKDATIAHLVPPVLLLLRDAASEVRLNLISSLSSLNEVIGVDLLSQSLLPAILDLAQDGKWRIRFAIIKHIPLLAKQLGKDFFSEKLASLCVGWLGDDIATIRVAAAHNLKELTSLFGAQWAIDHIVPSIEEIRYHTSYLRRLTALNACMLMMTKMEPTTATTELLPFVLEMTTDAVANIRFTVAKGMKDVAPLCGQRVYSTQIRPVLQELMEDTDRDVRFFSREITNDLDEKLGQN